MKKDILKGTTMLMLLVAVTLVTAVVSANAQSNPIKANIPFEFIVGDKTLPAGEYTVKPATTGGALAIQNADGKGNVVRMTGPTEQKTRGRARMVFHRYGHNYFLAEVWDIGTNGRELAKSKQERAVERELASISSKSELAQSTYETVVVVAAAH
jgi:hypothetical protein